MISRLYSNTTDIHCDSNGLTSSYSQTDQQCYLDQAALAYNLDVRPTLTGTQKIITHIVGIDTDSDTVADALYQNALRSAMQTEPYTSTDGSYDELLSAVMSVISSVRSGSYSRSTPVVSADGKYSPFGSSMSSIHLTLLSRVTSVATRSTTIPQAHPTVRSSTMVHPLLVEPFGMVERCWYRVQ